MRGTGPTPASSSRRAAASRTANRRASCSEARSWRPLAPEAALRGLKLFQAKGSTDSGFCANVRRGQGCEGELRGQFWMCEGSNPYEFALCAACAAAANVTSGAPPPAGAEALFAECPPTCRGRPLVACRAGHAVEAATFGRLAAQGIEVVGNASWSGGHKLPGAGERMWHHIAQFYAGKL